MSPLFFTSTVRNSTSSNRNGIGLNKDRVSCKHAIDKQIIYKENSYTYLKFLTL